MARPGIFFETVPPPTPNALPRMDIAAFVGFADAGPLDVPVPIEDMAHFRAIFGDDPTLAFDAQRGVMQRGYLGGAVDAFLASGGRRCWVVRVADDPGRKEFVIPGLGSVQAGASGLDATSVTAPARAPGIWADGLRVHTTLIETPLIPTNGSPLDIAPDGGGDVISLTVVGAPETVTVGDTIRLQSASADRQLFFVAESVDVLSRGLRVRSRQWFLTRSGPEAAPGDGELLSPALELLASSQQRLGPLSSWLGDDLRVDLVSFELSTWREDTLDTRVDRLAFSPRHPRFWGNLPDDDQLFWRETPRRADHRDTELLALWDEARGIRNPSAPPGRRFALAGPLPVQAASRAWPMYLPSAMPRARRPAPFVAAMVEGPLTRSGLEQIAAGMFIDPRLSNYGGDSLLRSAEFIQNEAREQASRLLNPTIERLRGIHALLSIDEVTLVAVPDAVHRPWSNQQRKLDDLLAAPELVSASLSPSGEQLAVEWTRVARATSYRLEISTAADFTVADAQHDFDDVPSSLNTMSVNIPRPLTCEELLYMRVNAEQDGTPSPWSNTRSVEKHAGNFRQCRRLEVELPLVAEQVAATPSDPGAKLAWSADGDEPAVDAQFEVDSCGDALFSSAVTSIYTSMHSILLPETGEGPSYWRVRVVASDGAVGPWSNTLVWTPTALARPLLDPAPNAADGIGFDDTRLLAIHRGLLRFCHARGDMLGILTLPRHYRGSDVEDYLSSITPDDGTDETPAAPTGGQRPLTLAESPALSYGALYYPWLAHGVGIDRGARDPRFMPCDGIAAGNLARIALERGAWIAAANRVIDGVLATDPLLPDAQIDRLHDLQVNVLVRAPIGYVFHDDLTLSRDSDVRPVSVRRLLILLKRLALREGAGLVLEPNDVDLQERVYTDFERVLSSLHQRGAFKGVNADEAFAVVADASVNPQDSIDAGRFIVELRVAPSEPLKFLRVRLVQSGPQSLSAGEA
jgi:hypothetical protein